MLCNTNLLSKQMSMIDIRNSAKCCETAIGMDSNMKFEVSVRMKIANNTQSLILDYEKK